MRAGVLVVGAFFVLSLALSGAVTAFDPQEQVLTSDLILTGRVLSVRPGPKASAVDVEVDQIWKGETPARRIVVTAPAGALDNPGLALEGSARFAEGESVLLFLTRVGETWRPWRTVFGKYTIRGTGLDARLAGAAPLVVDDVEAHWLGLDEIRQEVRLIAARASESPDLALRTR